MDASLDIRGMFLPEMFAKFGIVDSLRKFDEWSRLLSESGYSESDTFLSLSNADKAVIILSFKAMFGIDVR